MIASIFSEFMVWRKSRSSKLLRIEENDDEEQFTRARHSDNMLAFEVPSVAPKQTRIKRLFAFFHRLLWCGPRKWTIALSLCWILFGFVLTYVAIGHFSLPFMYANSALSVLFFVLLHLHLSSGKNSHAWTHFLFGILIVGLTGPLYIFLTIHSRLRQSESWHKITRGANCGFVGTSVALYLVLVKTSWRGVWIGALWPAFCILYGVCVLLIYVIRSTSEKRRFWYLGILPFFCGFILGPFCWFFRNCFPEVESHADLSLRVRQAFLSGIVLLILVIDLVIILWSAFSLRSGSPIFYAL